MLLAMPLKSVRVTGLFGALTHDINLDRPDRITILHGPNGVGKTTVLRLLYLALRRRFAPLRRIPFKTLELGFEDGSLVSITREEAKPEDGAAQAQIVVSVRSGAHLPMETTIKSEISRDFPMGRVEDFLPWLRRAGAREWYDSDLDELIEYDDVMELYGDHLPIGERSNLPDELLALLESVPVQIIETQRLSAPLTRPAAHQVPHRRPVPVSAVKALADDLVVQMRGELATYAEVSQSLDQTFPNRLLEQSEPPQKATDEAIRERYKTQGNNRDHLIDVGLLDPGAPGGQLVLPERRLTTAERNVLWTYLGDVDRKLQTLYEIAAKVDLFREIVNSKYEGKSVVIRRSEGFAVVRDGGGALDPRHLSSGEQHELVLAYRLLFDVQPGSLILIDEPELSLHVSWQQQFLPDLGRISQLANLDFLLATHSPTIVGSRWDLTEALSTTSD